MSAPISSTSRNVIILLLGLIGVLVCIIFVGIGAFLFGVGPFQVAQAPTPTQEVAATPTLAEEATATPTPTEEATATPTPTPTPTNTPTPTPIPAPQILSFTADSNPINQGDCTTLRWNTRNAPGGVELTGPGVVAAAGEYMVCPATSTRYMLVAEGAPGASPAEVSAQVTVLVRLTQVFNVNAGNSGHIIGNLGGASSLNPFPNVGDDTANQGRKAFMDWDITSIPVGSSIDFAALNLGDHDTLGNFFGSFAGLVVAELNYGTLGLEDWPATGSSNIQVLTSPPSAAAPLNVTASVRRAFNEGRRFQIVFGTGVISDGDGVSDLIRFSEAAGDNTLAVTYTLPAP